MRDCLGLGLTLAASVNYSDVYDQGLAMSAISLHYRPLPRYRPRLSTRVPRPDCSHPIQGSSPASDPSVQHCKSTAPAPHPPYSSLPTFNPRGPQASLSQASEASAHLWADHPNLTLHVICGVGKESGLLPLLLALP